MEPELRLRAQQRGAELERRIEELFAAHGYTCERNAALAVFPDSFTLAAVEAVIGHSRPDGSEYDRGWIAWSSMTEPRVRV